MQKFKTVFCGTPDFSVPCLDLLANHPLIDLVTVVTMPDREAGRGKKLTAPPVAQFAKALKLPLAQTENINKESDLLATWEEKGIDLIIVLAFAQFLSDKILSIPTKGCFNIHTSLLPKYRGAAPIQYALLNGDEKSGVTIQKMVRKMDAGDIVFMNDIELAPWETGGQLYTRLKFLSATSLNDFLREVYEGKMHGSPQDDSQASFAPTLRREDGLLQFKKNNSQAIYNQVRALKPWPGTYCFLGEKRLKVLDIEITSQTLEPGSVDTQQGQLLVGSADRKAIRLKFVQLEGKKACFDYELLNGFKNSEQKILINSKV